MTNLTRDEQSGKFTKKSTQKRKVRSIRLTDRTYNYLKEKGEENNQTIADLIEQIAEERALDNKSSTNVETLKQKSIDIIFGDDIRSRDRGLIKKVFAKLLSIDRSFYPRVKPSNTR